MTARRSDHAGPARRAGRAALRALVSSSAVAVLLASAACETESVVTSDGRPMPPKPRRVAPPPPTAVPTRMTLVVAPSIDDTDGNGYPDLIHVVAALFDYPEHPTSMEAHGAFVFTLYRQGEARRPGAEALAEWQFDESEVGPRRGRAYYGVCYQFALSLTEKGTDRRSPVAADLRGRFEPAAGGPPILCSDELRPVQIGRADPLRD